MRDDGSAPAVPTPLADWRQAGEDQRIDAAPAHLRERLATTAEQVASTFAFAAQVRARMAGRGGAEADDHRSRAAWNRLVADFERRQAAALRSGRLLATPWRPVPDARDHRRRP